MNPFEIPGCTFVGYVRADNVNGGRPIPLFDPVQPVGQPDINTLEGWNTAAEKQNRRSFRACFGRDPVHDAELWEWVYSQL